VLLFLYMNIISTLRQPRIFSYAIFDLALTFLAMWLLAPWLSKLALRAGVIIPEISWVIWALPLGISVHLLVGSMTPMTEHFLDLNGYYLLKIFILFLIVFGLRGIKVVS